MSLKKTSLLALLLLCLIGYIYAYEIPKEQSTKSHRDPLSQLEDSQISSLTINSSGEMFSLVNVHPENEKNSSTIDAKNWSFKEWSGVPVDGSSLKSFLNGLRNLGLQSPLPKDEVESDRSLYGLHAPTLQVVVEAKGIKKTLLIGKEVEYLSKKYAQFLEEPSELYLVPAFKVQEINKKKEDLRLKKFFNFTESKTKEITYTPPDGSLTTLKKNDSLWMVETSQGQFKASQEKVSSIIKELNDIQSTSILSASEGERVFSSTTSPLLKVSLKNSDDKAVEITLQRKNLSEAPNKMGIEPVVFITSAYPGIYSEYNSNPVQRIALSVTDLRDKKLMSFSQFDSTEAVIEENGKAPIHLSSNDQGWKVDEEKGDPVFILDFLSKYASAEAIAFVDAGKEESGTLVLKTSLTLKSGVKKEVSVERLSDGRILFVGDQRGIISEETLKGLFPKKETLLQQKQP